MIDSMGFTTCDTESQDEELIPNDPNLFSNQQQKA